MRALNNANVEMNHRGLFRAIIAKNSAYIRSGDMLSYDESAELMARYAEGNRVLAERYYRDSAIPLFPELVPSPPPEIWPLESDEFFQLTVDVLNALIERALEGKVHDPASKKGMKRRAKRRGRRNKAENDAEDEFEEESDDIED